MSENPFLRFIDLVTFDQKIQSLENDIVVIEAPEGIPEGSIMVTIWPHYLSVAKVKLVREGSIYAPQLFNIDL